MTEEHLSYRDMFVQDFNQQFLASLVDKIKEIYPKSYRECIENDDLGEAEGKYLLGHKRRALAETILARSAAEHGILCVTNQPQGGGCSHKSIELDRFILDLCHVNQPNGFPTSSDNRQQSSEINEHTTQLSFSFDQKKGNGSKFYGVIIHSESSNEKSEFGTIKIGIPNADFTAWVDTPVCLLGVLDIQNQLAPTEDLQGEIQHVKPKWKNLPEAKNQTNKQKRIRD